MTFRLVDRVRETTISPGTGTATLAGAALGYQTFSAGVGASNTTYYVIADQSGSNWEVGYGTVGAGGTTLARTTVLSSSNAGSLVNFSSGTQDVWVDYPATKAVFQDINGLVTVPTFSTSSTTSTTPVLSFNASNTSFASGATVSGNYLQFLLQNKSGTAGASTNYVLSNDIGTDSTYYGEFGMNSSVFSATTPADFFSINNGIYFSGHDGDVTVGSGNGFKTYLAWGTTGQSAHVINAVGALGFSTNLGTTPALSGTTGYGTAGQVPISAGSTGAVSWSSTPTLVGTNFTGTASGLSIGGNAATATTATNQSGGTVAATTGSFSGLITSLMGDNTRIFNSATATTGYQYFGMANTGANLIFGIEGSAAGSLVTGDSAYDAIFSTQNTTGITFGINSSKVFRLQSAGADVFGQLGVTSTLSVGGQITSTANGAFFGSARGSNSSYAIIGNTGGNLFVGRDDSTGSIISGVSYAALFWNSGNQPLLFGTNGSEKARINAGGGVSIGTTTDSGNTNLLVAGTITSNSTSNTKIATGTTAQQPGSSVVGMIRMNTTTNLPEFYNGTVWVSLQPLPYSIDTLIVAGGGGGLLASGAAGGSGAGGYLEGSFSLSPGVAYTVTVGAGGTGSSGVNTTPSVGSNSVFNSATAFGGGTGSGNNITGQAGGSGAGAGGYGPNSSGRPNTAATQTSNNGLAGYGFTGGTTYPSAGGNYGGSGGGGAGAVGVDCTNSVGGNGGAGKNWQSLGTVYAGGGGGGHESGTPGTGGSGGGGNGGITTSVATSGTANRGGGAGGSASGYTGTGASGGSGIVIIRYLGTQRGSGGTVTSAGGYTYHTFTSSGTFTA